MKLKRPSYWTCVLALLTVTCLHVLFSSRRFKKIGFSYGSEPSHLEDSAWTVEPGLNHSRSTTRAAEPNQTQHEITTRPVEPGLNHLGSTTEQAEPGSDRLGNVTQPLEPVLEHLGNVTQPVLVVVVSTCPRSGSSFLGEMLSSPADAIYFFEPFWYADQHGHSITKDMHLSPVQSKRDFVQRELLNLLTCRLSSLPPMFNESLNMHIWRKPLLLAPLNVQQRTSICSDHDLRVAKVIRPGLASVLPLLQIKDHNIHIVHLVRDPRAIINSLRGNEGWSKSVRPAKLCDNLREDLSAVRRLTSWRYSRVRYEDMVAHPLEEARRLFGRMGLALPAEVAQFVDSHTKRSSKRPAPRADTAVRYKELLTRSLKEARRLFGWVGLEPRKKITQSVGSKRKSYSNEVQRETAKLELLDSAARYRHRRAAQHRDDLANIDFNDYYGTVRDVKFDSLHWLKELSAEVRNEVEQDCGDVLGSLGYPLLYPEERQSEGERQAAV